MPDTAPSPADVLLFCVCCFGSEEDASWGGDVFRDYCTNCGSGGSSVSLTRAAIESIRRQASWVGKRFYPHKEDKEREEELQDLREHASESAGREVEWVPPRDDLPGHYWVKQDTGEGSSTCKVVYKAASFPDALEQARAALPWFSPERLARAKGAFEALKEGKSAKH